jgi:hypothetical protein
MLAEQTNQTYTVNILSQDKTKMLTDKYNYEDGLHKITPPMLTGRLS